MPSVLGNESGISEGLGAAFNALSGKEGSAMCNGESSPSCGLDQKPISSNALLLLPSGIPSDGGFGHSTHHSSGVFLRTSPQMIL